MTNNIIFNFFYFIILQILNCELFYDRLKLELKKLNDFRLLQ